ncbi:hypothetical protein [Methanocella conradii]|uniref:hypothetical protein n=1 Tax=Methanocella conradii TaxID=1175444 RepID=UPI00157C6AE9|nr:hypothetical protein [Methanocella conradii]
MDISIIALYVLAVVGPLMVFLTHYVVRGRSRDMTRLWFITFFSYMIYYWLAKSYGFFNDPEGVVDVFSLLWPIAAISSFWISERLSYKGTGMPFFKWMTYFLVTVVFAFLLDGAGGVMHWYTYSPEKLGASPFINPIGGMAMPALMPFLLGILMMGVFFLTFSVHKELRKRRIGETSATLLLAALSIAMGGALWVASDLVVGFVKSIL